MPPSDETESMETDEFIYPDAVLEAMEFSLQRCRKCKSNDIQDLELGNMLT